MTPRPAASGPRAGRGYHRAVRAARLAVALGAAGAVAALAPIVAAAPARPAPPNPVEAWTARILAPVSARVAPRMSARAIITIQPVAPLGGGPTVLLVTGRAAVDGRTWVQVRLPVRPNGSQGWLPTDVLRFNRTSLRIVIDQSARTLTLYRAGHRVLRTTVAIGTPATPTPNGRFAVAERILTHTPGAFLGPVVMPLTGYSNTLNEYAGGNGRVAIHGTSLPELLGTRASHGCIRVANRDIVRLSRLVRPGAPVLIRP
jgi:lipoprotein-anchoring transpeptidase ErfK/SrfK